MRALVTPEEAERIVDAIADAEAAARRRFEDARQADDARRHRAASEGLAQLPRPKAPPRRRAAPS